MNVDNNSSGYARLLCDERLVSDQDDDSISAASNRASGDIVVDSASEAKINAVIDDVVIPCRNVGIGQLLARVSETFLDTPYQANTLICSLSEKERLVADLCRVDCFTLLDYVCALIRSHTQSEFFAQLALIRYQAGEIDYLNRNHFFSDWFARSPANAVDITNKLSPDVITVTKHLNRKGIDEKYLPGLGIVERKITYIPTKKIDENIMDRLNSGDLIGIYSKSQGLDVSHVGFLIIDSGGIYLRNASSLEKNMRVVDSPFQDYINNKLGIVVLRLR